MLAKLAFLKRIFEREEKKKMTIRLEARIDENTMKKLEEIKIKTGLSKTEILTDLINYSEISDFKMLVPTKEEKEEEKDRQIKLVATRKYLAYLYKNLTTNMNQIAHVLNEAGITEKNKSAFRQAFDFMAKQATELTKLVKEATKNDK